MTETTTAGRDRPPARDTELREVELSQLTLQEEEVEVESGEEQVVVASEEEELDVKEVFLELEEGNL